ncbi:uncharacterized protein HMPREF1541_10664 [Cyphellophora europaea CBS 101466]|uniref:DUF1868 domain-containing protein n=1 Tax=Cyphellophora europaea (strain CBS 101466) TaxID=1220924 RepID=W2S854_CYPE1|nr:uncharacterized protein HMPREF1541_10664 [Cyphellophora europaea CBS 101466]ETN44114.1 hypothetical protein HMPREF1541_10664 [Cyphellophora europaea CBS 101466]
MAAADITAMPRDAAFVKSPDHSNRDEPEIPLDYDPEHRVEPVPKSGFPHHLYPRWIGQKFTPNGAVLPYPGNTIVCHLPENSPLRPRLLDLYHDIQQQEFSSLFTLLPPSSWHMTVYEGVTDQIRTRSCWPGELPLDSTLRQCHAHTASRLADFDAGLGTPFVMKIVSFEELDDGIALKLAASTPETDTNLRGLRDRLSHTLKMRHPGHETYSFHLSIAYTLRHLMEKERARIWAYLQAWQAKSQMYFDLGSPEYCVYDDMFGFRRMFLLEG